MLHDRRHMSSFLRRCLGPSQAGMSLPATMVAVAIFGIVAAGISTVMQQMKSGTKSMEFSNDINSMRKTIQDNFDCRKSLGSPPSATLPLACTLYLSIPILRSDGSSLVGVGGKMGVWTVTAGCNNNQIVFTATKVGVDPLTKKPWSQSPALTNPNNGQPDLFRGTSSFCSSFFIANFSNDNMPSGAVVLFNLTACPNGWVSLTSGLAGVNGVSDLVTCQKQ